MFDLCLVVPPSPWLISDNVELPLGILYLASWVRSNGYSVNIIDYSGNNNPDIPEAKYYGIGFVSPQFVIAKKIKDQIREKYSKSIIIAGGCHTTALPNEVLNEGFDIAVCGEGEAAILDILQKGKTKVIYELNYNSDINSLPFPAWDLVDMEKYINNIGVVTYMNTEVKREINVMATRGCTGKCSYCTKYKGNLRWRGVNNIIDELKILRDKYNVNRIFFVDDNIIIKKSFLYSLCDEMKKIKMNWHCLGRADQVDYESCKKMFDSGCMGIDFGIESGSQKILNVINKNTTVEKQEQGIKNACLAGLKVRAQFMVGLPNETEDDYKLNLEFIERNNEYVTKWGIHIFIPFPTCDIWRNSEKYNYDIDKNTDFSNYQTIGKPNEWNYKASKNNEIYNRRREEILRLIKEKSIQEIK